MSVLNNTWHQLVKRRLLPVAVLLLGAAVAVPMLLAKDPKPAPAAASGADRAEVSAAPAKPIVQPVSDASGVTRRRVLGAPKNPFAPAPLPKVKPKSVKAKPDQPANLPAVQLPSSGPKGGDVSVGGSTPSAPSAPSAPVSVPPSSGPTATVPTQPSKPTYPKNSVTVRFSGASSTSSDGGAGTRTVERLEPLPSESSPALVYLGLENGGKTAVFLVASDIEIQGGDGSCDPSPEDCETLRLHAGETEFLERPGDTADGGAEYELDVLKIHAGTTASASAAKASASTADPALAEAAANGRELMREHAALIRAQHAHP